MLPAPLRDQSFADSVDLEPADLETLHYMLLLSTRVSRVHGVVFNRDHTLRPCQSDRLKESIAPLLVRSDDNIEAFIMSLARDAGLAVPKLRSDQAWMGGGNPLEASLVLPDASHLPSQLADLLVFLRAHQTSGCRRVAEALAFQLLTIHPLADGNGRATRALLIKLSARSRSLYPLYFAWRLMFDKRRTALNWASLCASGKPDPNSAHYERWAEIAGALNTTIRKSQMRGIDKRIVASLLLYGHITLDTLICANLGCTTSLARKLIASIDTHEAKEAFDGLNGGIINTIDRLNYAVVS